MRRCIMTVTLCALLFLVAKGQQVEMRRMDPGVVVEMDLTSGRPIVELMINGKGPYKFIFDTGALGHAIDEGVAEELGLEVLGEEEVRTGGGGSVTSKKMKAPKVSFPGTEISKDAEMFAMNLRAMLPIDGVLSGNFVSDHLITMDFPNSRIVLKANEGLTLGSNGVTPLSDKQSRNLNLDVDIAGNTFEAHLNSGSPMGFLVPVSLKDKLKFMQEPQEDGEGRSPAGAYKKWRAQLDGNIVVGGAVFENPHVTLADGFSYVDIGNQIIQDMRLTLDLKNRLVKFETISEKEKNRETNDFTGWYGGKLRQILIEDGQLYLERGPSRLRLDLVEGEFYDMVPPMQVNNEIPDVRFERDGNGKVKGFTFVFAGGREEFVPKDK